MLVVVSPSFCRASTTGIEKPQFVTVTIDNDLFAGDDGHYTNGVQIASLVERDRLPGLVRKLPPLSIGTDSQFVFAVGQRIYTPANIDISKPDPGDRPYAGWLYLAADARTTVGDTVDHYMVSFGVVGPASLGRQSQSEAHRFFSSRAPRGWDSQVRNTPTALLGAERAWRGLLSTSVGESQVDFSPRIGATLGNIFTYANTGAVLRFGKHLPDDLPATHISLGPPRDGYRGASQFGYYLWTGLDVRAVARDLLLEGSTFADGPHVQRKRLGYDAQLGAAMAWPSARLGFTYVQRSLEFEGQHRPDRFGQITVSFAD